MLVEILAAMHAMSASPSCEHLRTREIERLADSVDAASLYQGSTNALVRLHEYWRSVCKSERTAAPASVVIRLATLLSIRDARLLVSSELIDIGPKLKHAAPYVDAAAADEKRRYDELTSKNPIVFNGRIFYDPLMCVKLKIEKGRLDRVYCRGILSAG